jgi:ABC-type glycerol-3-phosphate transport system permease component
MGSLFSVGFEKIILLYTPMTYETADVISSFTYRKGLLEANYGYSTAVGLFNSVINFSMLLVANFFSRKYSETSLSKEEVQVMVYKKTFGKVVFDIINVTVLVFIAAMCIMPILHVLFSSLSDPRALARNEGVVLWPLGEPTLKGYELVFQNPNIVQGYGNTLFYVTVGTTLGTFMTALCGYVLSRKDILYRGILTFFVTFTMMFSGGLIPFYMVVRNLGWIDKRIALIVPGSISVFNVIVVRTAFMSIPDSLEESAKLDGAGHITILFNIILRCLKRLSQL